MNDKPAIRFDDVYDAVERNLNTVTVMAGLPKTGTTLPLTLLDGHPDLLVFPEELRFFYSLAHKLDSQEAAETLLTNYNTKMLARKDAYFKPERYRRHGGTGFGRRDYSQFDFNVFSRMVRKGFVEKGAFEHRKGPGFVNSPAWRRLVRRKSDSASVRKRLYSVIAAYCAGLGRIPDRPINFVCKAPHNENYSKVWHRILGDRGRYVITTRIPTEHYLSLKNVAELKKNAEEKDISEYIALVRRRRKLWDGFPEQCRVVLDYDTMTETPGSSVRQVLDLIGVGYDAACDTPTKMGIPWAGNSSRGIVKEAVFRNPHRALEELSTTEIDRIQSGLKKLYREQKWELLQV